MARDGEEKPGGFRISATHIATIAGLLIALAAAGAYYYYFVRGATSRQSQAPIVAKVTAIEGKAKLRRGGRGEWVDVNQTTVLRTGDVVKTELASGVEITFNNGNIVRVRPDSIVLIGDVADVSQRRGRAADWRLQSGQVNFEIVQGAEISTPNANASAAGNSAGNIRVAADGDTGIKIFRGSAQVETKEGQKITLNTNEGVQVDAQGKTGKKVVLPEPPILLQPPRQAELRFVTPPGATARLEWKPVAGGVTYHVAMDYNVTQANLLLSAALDAPGVTDTVHELKGLDAGKYFWRVSAVNQEGVEGDFSKVAMFSVVRPPEPAPAALGDKGPTLVVEPLDVLANVVQVRGRTDPGTVVTLDGNEVKVQADGSFSEYIQKVAKQQVVVIRATGPNGEVTEQKHSAN
jgi:hypothetical protein